MQKSQFLKSRQDVPFVVLGHIFKKENDKVFFKKTTKFSLRNAEIDFSLQPSVMSLHLDFIYQIEKGEFAIFCNQI